jgi:SAM-dependent methyltransferase
MSHWQERITRETAPAIRVEHELRYRLAAPLIAGSGSWADLGCGNGLAPAAALEGSRPARIVLVDRDSEAVARAATELAAPDAVALTADLTSAGDLAGIGEALLAGAGGDAVVSCFEVVEHLDTFLPLLEWSGRLAREHAVTFVLSVPNDAFWSISNPHHHTAWGEGAFEELRRLLPDEKTLLRQVALAGSGLVDWQGTPERHELAADVGGESVVATHFIAAFGPGHAELARGALAAQTDMIEQRRWERQRESDLAVMETLTRERDEWRTYIHELERELGRPLSGVAQGEQPEIAQRPA